MRLSGLLGKKIPKDLYKNINETSQANYKRGFNRINDLYSRMQALLFLDKFINGIRNDDLGLESLAKETVDRKRKMGYAKPSSPLYGAGLESGGGRSYVDFFVVKKVKNGYEVSISRTKKHHSRMITLLALFKIHERGITIDRGDTLIRIPPRPAAANAYEAFKRSQAKIVYKSALKELLAGKQNGKAFMKMNRLAKNLQSKVGVKI